MQQQQHFQHLQQPYPDSGGGYQFPPQGHQGQGPMPPQSLLRQPQHQNESSSSPGVKTEEEQKNDLILNTISKLGKEAKAGKGSVGGGGSSPGKGNSGNNSSSKEPLYVTLREKRLATISRRNQEAAAAAAAARANMPGMLAQPQQHSMQRQQQPAMPMSAAEQQQQQQNGQVLDAAAIREEEVSLFPLVLIHKI